MEDALRKLCDADAAVMRIANHMGIVNVDAQVENLRNTYAGRECTLLQEVRRVATSSSADMITDLEDAILSLDVSEAFKGLFHLTLHRQARRYR